MPYPSSIDSFPNPAGTNTLDSPDHAGLHGSINTAVIAIQTVVGTTAGTNVLKNFAAGDFPSRINSSNVLQQAISGTITSGTIGTLNVGLGTVNTLLINTSNFTGGTITSAVVGTFTGGTANGMTLGTPVIGTVTVPGTTAPLSFSAAIAPGIGTVADAAGGTLTVNAQAAQIYYSVMGTAAGNRTVGTPANPIAGQQLTYAFKTSGSANGTLVWPTGTGAFTFSQDSGTPALGTGVSWHYFGWRYNGVESRFHFMGQSKNVI